jgi:hypothetical protein
VHRPGFTQAIVLFLLELNAGQREMEKYHSKEATDPICQQIYFPFPKDPAKRPFRNVKPEMHYYLRYAYDHQYRCASDAT